MSNIELKERLEYSDVTYAYLWDKSDYEVIAKRYALIRFLDRTKNIKDKRQLIEELEYELERSRNDQTSDYEPLDFIEKLDRITNGGRGRAAELIAGEAANHFDYAHLGTSQIPVDDADSKLYAEVPDTRINIRLNGYGSASGAIIKHSGLWSPGQLSNTYWEFAPVDLPVYSILQVIWARVVFPANRPLVHIQNSDFFTITHSTYTTSQI
jgi:hypothetical protein